MRSSVYRSFRGLEGNDLRKYLMSCYRSHFEGRLGGRRCIGHPPLTQKAVARKCTFADNCTRRRRLLPHKYPKPTPLTADQWVLFARNWAI